MSQQNSDTPTKFRYTKNLIHQNSETNKILMLQQNSDAPTKFWYTKIHLYEWLDSFHMRFRKPNRYSCTCTLLNFLSRQNSRVHGERKKLTSSYSCTCMLYVTWFPIEIKKKKKINRVRGGGYTVQFPHCDTPNYILMNDKIPFMWNLRSQVAATALVSYLISYRDKFPKSI